MRLIGDTVKKFRPQPLTLSKRFARGLIGPVAEAPCEAISVRVPVLQIEAPPFGHLDKAGFDQFANRARRGRPGDIHLQSKRAGRGVDQAVVHAIVPRGNLDQGASRVRGKRTKRLAGAVLPHHKVVRQADKSFLGGPAARPVTLFRHWESLGVLPRHWGGDILLGQPEGRPAGS